MVDKMGILAEKRGEHGNEGDADQGNAATGHQLYHGELVVKWFTKIPLKSY